MASKWARIERSFLVLRARPTRSPPASCATVASARCYLLAAGTATEAEHASVAAASAGLEMDAWTLNAATAASAIAAALIVLNSARQIGGMLGVPLFGYLMRDTAP